ncbi:peptidoglycan editing factor PgeF [Alkalicoccus chagannorensis]|uniref:peptidoglycan editing factor PgeF n=1 Tax=Alkalicoccus chagannorensis TaxID=427072 RepID=UPI00041C4250|nr:peptidoglycan editing factor PgeF [Alkalicoccus chagannorensis]
MESAFVQQQHTLHLNEWENKRPGLTAGFTLRTGGVSLPPYHSANYGLHVQDDPDHVRKNRQSLAGAIGFPISSWVAAEQTHGDQIVKVTQPLAGSGSLSYEDTIKRTDGFYTQEKNILLTLGFADCIPMYFFSPEKEMIGTAHAGWKGTVQNITGKMVRLWNELEDIHPGTILAAVGPGIGPCCYTVDEHVITQLQEVLPNHEPFEKNEDGTYQLSLREANYHLLIQEGVPPQNILYSTDCTSCRESQYFSHRRDEGTTGRMISFIGLK